VQAVYHNQLAVVERLLRDPRANPSAFQNEAIWVACHFSDINIVECLLRDPRVDPSANEHRALYEACGRGNVAIVDRLLQDPRVTPNVTRIGASSPLSWAACSNRLEVVARLLEDPRTDVSDPILLQDACRSVEMTNLFIQRGLEPTARTLLQACGHGTLEVVQFLAQFVPLTENMRDVALASGYRDKAE
jgi:ankyrin repeat protein